MLMSSTYSHHFPTSWLFFSALCNFSKSLREKSSKKKQTESQITLDCHQDFFSYTKRRDAKFLEVFVRQSHKSRQINLKKWNHIRTITQNRAHKAISWTISLVILGLESRDCCIHVKQTKWMNMLWWRSLQKMEICLHSQLPLVLGRRWSILPGQFFLTVLGDLEKTSNIYLRSFLSFLS